MSWMVIFIVVFLFYMLTKGYKTADYQHIHVNKKQKLRGDLAEHEAGLLVALMAKVAKADGKVCELEAELLSLTFTDIAKVFEDSEAIREQLKEIYKREMQSFDNTITVSQKYLKLTSRDYRKRLGVMEYLLNLAFIDSDFSKAEFMICEDIANALEIKRADFEGMIARFEQFYTQKREQAGMNLKKAYEVLGLEEGVEFAVVKKEYRKLVRQYHPDILMGQGKEQSIIDQATEKLQEINEAYEIVKKNLV
ncbi:MAG TPA: molecular chaperone DjlA [Sulfurospirillum arcachonense]|nr:molecular chaperone DjlA [Sulfurospirillum arcachonense]HIP45140.1 molecular chaperone DjlA [Sulfurospirillum arcachonense]